MSGKILMSRLPKFFRKAMENTFERDRGYCIPKVVDIEFGDKYKYFVEAKMQHYALFFMGEEGKSRSDLFIGYRNGRSSTLPVDFDTEERVLKENQIVFTGYLGSGSQPEVIEPKVLLHSSKFSKMQVIVGNFEKLTDRERQILYPFGTLKDGFERREALIRLQVSDAEINSLVSRGLLRKSNSHIMITDFGKANQSSKRIIDQW